MSFTAPGRSAQKLNDRSDGIYLLILGCIISAFLGVALELGSPVSMLDFKTLYFGARCIAHHVDPYGNGEVIRLYVQEGNQLPPDDNSRLLYQSILGWCVYPPTALVFFLPFAVISFGAAHIVWMALLISSFAAASALAWNLGSDFDTRLSSLLVAFLLANNVLVIASGNPAGLVVSLCVFATWSFVRQRLIWMGAICLAIAIGLKPQNAGFIWLFFFLAGVNYRKRAFQTALVVLVPSLPATLWVWHIAPNWFSELRSNLADFQLPGGISDPHLAAAGHYGVSGLITLQSAFSFFRNEPTFYNAATYLICAPLLLFWAWITLRSSASPARTWLALAALLPLSMLPVYHRSYDAKLLILTIPACVMLWGEGRRVGRVALGMSLAALIATSDIPWMVLQIIGNKLHLADVSVAQRMLVAVWVVPTPLILLTTGIFYLWIYARRVQDLSHETEVGELFGLP